ncbi:MAG: hypothetical protein IPM29_32750 [Planctomycetes bacterium]|nr:hypothetical protein [Planctomycetota bacterium]
MRFTGTIGRPVPRIQPLLLLLTAVAGWVHREQARTITYLIEENGVLRKQLGAGDSA